MALKKTMTVERTDSQSQSMVSHSVIHSVVKMLYVTSHISTRTDYREPRFRLPTFLTQSPSPNTKGCTANLRDFDNFDTAPDQSQGGNFLAKSASFFILASKPI